MTTTGVTATTGTTAAAGQGPRADCVVDTAGGLALELTLPGAHEPRLLLRLRPPKGKDPERRPCHEVEMAPAGDGLRWLAVVDRRSLALGEGTLEEGALEEGRWDLFVVDGEGEPAQVRAGINDVRALVERERDRSASPIAVRIPYATKTGHLAVRAWLRPVHAEAGEIRVGDSSLTVHATVFGADPGPEAAAVARLRGSKGRERVETPVTAEGGGGGGGGAFSFTLDLRELARAPAVWDLCVRLSHGGSVVRIGRLLDDVPDKKKIFVYPGVRVDALEARPYFTLDNDLSVDVRVV
ncbi:transferase [Wenjunlia tyrosinilytica]|uniref:Transferase n=1 Tax=Wenjunlia tyrosinilytica TaxID=1544741 RepID=A0A917ZXA3_9ACTN|nr:transferase [Wenjunlia tyrosinilytica]GGO95279.1 hypothetical protein GCM10012280_52100 [Wenjunlia tyrosinilytica]